jgi:hypothetical protein
MMQLQAKASRTALARTSCGGKYDHAEYECDPELIAPPNT